MDTLQTPLTPVPAAGDAVPDGHAFAVGDPVLAALGLGGAIGMQDPVAVATAAPPRLPPALAFLASAPLPRAPLPAVTYCVYADRSMLAGALIALGSFKVFHPEG